MIRKASIHRFDGVFMASTRPKSLRNLGLGFLLATVLFAMQPIKVHGAEVYVNSPLITDFVSGTQVTSAQYALRNTQYDTRLTNGGSITASNIITAALGNVAFLNNKTYDFTLEFRNGTLGTNRGFVWTLSDGGSSVASLAWGDFSPALVPTPNVQASTINGVAPSGAFNSIILTQRANSTAGTGSYLTISDLAFSSSPSVTQNGSWINSTITTPGGGPAAPIENQRLVSTSDLSTFSWTLSGKVTGFKDQTGGDETVSFGISVNNSTFNVVPEPATCILGMMAAGTLAFAARRRKRRAAISH
jgi:hypothetical protein